MFRERFSQAVTAALLWVVVGLVLVIGYSYRFELGNVADRVMAELIPGHVISHGRTVEVARTNAGDFDISAQINGTRVPMVLDTGASSVVLTSDDAKAAGLPLELLNYTVSIDTANGRTRAAPVTLDRHRHRRPRRAFGRGAGGAARPAAHQPARHELSQPAAKLAGHRRPADAARLSVVIRRPEVAATRPSKDTAGALAVVLRRLAALAPQDDGTIAVQNKLTKKRSDTSTRKILNVDFERAPRQPVGEPRAVGRRQARDRRHHRDPDQRDEAERQRRQQRVVVQTGENIADACRRW